MSISFPFKFVDLGETPPFKIGANPDFPTETEPVCILTNLGVAGGSPAPDTFITVGPLGGPNAPDTWELTFHWATTGGPAAGEWQIDAWLQSVTGPTGNLVVPGFPQIISGAVVPHHEEHSFSVLPFTLPPPVSGAFLPGVFLFRLYATLRWGPLGPRVRVAGRAEGPLIEFYFPAGV
jgi:hypothetical protein